MKWFAVVSLAAGHGGACRRAADPLGPRSRQTAKPWTRWWWPGSAVDRAEPHARSSKRSRRPVSAAWRSRRSTARAARSRATSISCRRAGWRCSSTRRAKRARLGLGVDMATGTGWPFGGPYVAAADGSSSLALVDGKLTGTPTQMKVKRPAPGGEGLVLDPYSTDALDRYLAPFSQRVRRFPRGGAARAVPRFVRVLQRELDAGAAGEVPEDERLRHPVVRRGARRRKPLDADTLSRVKGDYRRTLAQLHLDYVNAWVEWSHAQGFQARNQAHGAPGNLLDLYARRRHSGDRVVRHDRAADRRACAPMPRA